MIESQVKQRRLERLQRLSAGRRLLSRAQLDAYYATFRARFGPDRLANLDGEALLEAMRDTTRESLAYWLEFKSDDEFPTRSFGSIAGGSAAKFRLFRRKETGAWVAVEGNTYRDIPIEEAVAIARKHRNQLIRGVEILQTPPTRGSDADYRRLQEALDRDAPDVSGKAWGHKYFSLLFPGALDDHHAPKLQRFHLLKMLQAPPDWGVGRYTRAGRFVALAAELGVPINHLTTALNSFHGGLHPYWLVDASGGSRWSAMRDGDFVATVWERLDDLSWLPKKASGEDRERLQRLLGEKHPDGATAAGRIKGFVTEMAESDIIVAVSGGVALGIGRVIGDYAYEGEPIFPHQRPVEWLSLDEWRPPASEGPVNPIRAIRKGVNILEIERRIQASPGPIASQTRSAAARPIPGRTPRLDGVPGRVQKVLDRKGQCILHGPPGTGKTYWAGRTTRDRRRASRDNRRRAALRASSAN